MRVFTHRNNSRTGITRPGSCPHSPEFQITIASVAWCVSSRTGISNYHRFRCPGACPHAPEFQITFASVAPVRVPTHRNSHGIACTIISKLKIPPTNLLKKKSFSHPTHNISPRNNCTRMDAWLISNAPLMDYCVYISASEKLPVY